MTRFLKHFIRTKEKYINIYIIIAIQDKFTLKKLSLRIKFHEELSSTFSVVSISTFDNLNYLEFLYGRVRHSIFSDCSSLGFLFQKWPDWVLEFPGLGYIFHELVGLYF